LNRSLKMSANFISTNFSKYEFWSMAGEQSRQGEHSSPFARRIPSDDTSVATHQCPRKGAPVCSKSAVCVQEITCTKHRVQEAECARQTTRIKAQYTLQGQAEPSTRCKGKQSPVHAARASRAQYTLQGQAEPSKNEKQSDYLLLQRGWQRDARPIHIVRRLQRQ
jgi:hypothetical protein